MYAHYHRDTDIAWFLFREVEPGQLVSDQTEWGLRDYEASSDELVGLEFWQASERLPKELLDALPEPEGEEIEVTREDLARGEPTA